MKIILRQDFETLGKIGDLVDVKDGYARNYLFPRGFAYAALKGNLNALEEEKKSVEKRNQQELKAAEALASELETVSVTIPCTSGEEDKIFGTVTTQMIADALKEKSHDYRQKKN